MKLLPAIYFSAPYAALAAVIIVPWIGLEKKRARSLLLVTLLSLTIHVFWFFCIRGMPVPHDGPFFLIDDYTYDHYSWAIAKEWRAGNFPALWTDQYLGTLHTGWNRILAAIYYLFGRRPWIGILLNIIVGSLLAPLAFFTAREIFPSSPDPPATRRYTPAFLAGLVTAIHFSFAYWSSFLMRDTFIAALFLAGLFLILCLYRRPSIWQALALAFILMGLSILRIYSVGALLAGPAAYLLFFHERKKWFWMALGVIVVLAFCSRVFIPLRDYQNQLAYSFLNNLPDAGRTMSGSLLFCIRGIPRFFLSPYAWYVAPGPPLVNYMLYPGQWFLYLLIIPFALKGIWICMRESPPPAVFLIVPGMTSVFLFLLAYGGSVPRQRMYLEPLLIIFASWGLVRKDRGGRIPLYWYAFLVVFILAHSWSVWKRGLW